MALSLLVIVVILLLIIDPWGALRKESRQIVIQDPSKIDQVQIAGLADTVWLSRVEAGWQLSGGEDANPVAVENLLFAAERLQIDAVHTGAEQWSRDGLRKVSFMRGKTTLLQYETTSRDGRFMLRLCGSEKAFTVSLPGYAELDLSRVFSDLENHYMEHLLIDWFPSEIRHIGVEKRGQDAYRFSKNEFDVISCEIPQYDSLISMDLLDEESVRQLFTYFTSIRYDERVEVMPFDLAGEEGKDRWLASLNVELNGGEKHSLQIYSLPGDEGEMNHMFRALVIYDKSSGALVINYIYLDVLMRSLSAYFGDNLLQH